MININYNFLLRDSFEHSFNIDLRLTFAGDRLISCTSTTISIIGSNASTIDRLIKGIKGEEEVS